MFLRALHALLNLFGLTLNTTKTSPQLNEGEEAFDNVIEIDFTRGKRMQRSSYQPNEDDATNESLDLMITLSPGVLARMNMLKRLSGAESHIETIRRALAMYHTIIEIRVVDGRSVGYYDHDGVWVDISTE